MRGLNKSTLNVLFSFDLIFFFLFPVSLQLRRGRFLQVSEAAQKDGFTQRYRVAIPAQVSLIFRLFSCFLHHSLLNALYASLEIFSPLFVLLLSFLSFIFPFAPFFSFFSFALLSLLCLLTSFLLTFSSAFLSSSLPISQKPMASPFFNFPSSRV